MQLQLALWTEKLPRICTTLFLTPQKKTPAAGWHLGALRLHEGARRGAMMTTASPSTDGVDSVDVNLAEHLKTMTPKQRERLLRKRVQNEEASSLGGHRGV